MSLRRFIVSTGLVLGLVGGAAFAPPASAEQVAGTIKFRTGASSGTVSGSVRKGRPQCWLFTAAQGQRASFRLTGSNVVGSFVYFTDNPDEAQLQNDLRRYGAKSETVEIDIENEICVASLSGKRSYSLRLTIV
jgi:hypothetical protein